MPGFSGTRFLARIAKRIQSKSSRKKSRKKSDEAASGEEAFANSQLQVEALIAHQQMQFQELNLECSDSSTNNCKAPYPGSEDAIIEPEETFLRAFGINPTPRIFTKECSICIESLPPSSFISTNGCAHEYCSNCCKHHAEAKIMSGSSQIECPHPDCRHTYDIDQCSFLLSASNFDILNIRLTEAAIPASLKVYCPFADCSAFMEKSEKRSGMIHDTFAECCSCHRGFCQECNVPWHANKTCGEYRANEMNTKLSGDQRLRDLAKQEKWQQCADCHRMIELKRGCHHMTCLCGNEFCYVCGLKWKNKSATCTCELWEETRIITD